MLNKRFSLSTPVSYTRVQAIQSTAAFVGGTRTNSWRAPYRKAYIYIACLLLGASSMAAQSQILYANNPQLLEQQGGQVRQLNTGKNEHNFVSLSRNNRSVAFSTPDPTTNNGVVPSSDIYIYDRFTLSTRTVVDHTSDFSNLNSIATFTPVSAEVSPNGQLLAYGVQIALRQGQVFTSATKELNIANASNGLILANPTFGRGPVSDSLMAEFVGLSWDPGGTSLVTTNYITTQSALGTNTDLPAIVRFTNTGGSNWARTALTAPFYDNSVIPPTART